ncbi:MAG: tetratricopeptide repeat protein [Bacteroidetes bacterium]|nr:tetratricopeptide repeat protein [Bacteroidota bacterium]MCW5896026.1 tetratricopeptide repeat protein [Bacteroidota bacterium]
MEKRRKQRDPRSSAELPSSRKILFSAVLLLLPLLFFGTLEVTLRLFEYGGDLDLVVRRQVGKNEFYSINRSVANRYFAQTGTTVPEPADDTFEIKKQPNTKRVFCLGESTMAGFPYEFHATSPGFLRDRLRAALPQYNIEVVNVGLSAVGSYVVLDFIDELARYEPDLFVLYVGHNEFYGAYGVGSTVAVAGGPLLTRLTLTLLKFKSFLLLRDCYAWVFRLFSSEQGTPVGTMMQQMAATKTIPLGSSTYHEAKEIYRDNIRRIINVAKKKNVPIVFTTLVSNLKDHPPFVSVFNEDSSREHHAAWKRLIREGDEATLPADAAVKYREATELDTMNAEAYYKLGKALFTSHKYRESLAALIEAKDKDALRFRATEEFQHLLRTTCAENNVPVARADSAFAARSPGGIIGGELILEHLHPNIEGYFLMAKTMFETVRSRGLLATPQEWSEGNEPSDRELMELSTVSEFDSIVGALKVEFLKRRWPFQAGTTDFNFVPRNRVEEFALQYVQNRIPWSDARYQLAEYYAGIGQYDFARRECNAVARVIPFSYNPLLRIADYYRMEGKRKESVEVYKACIAVEDNPYAHIKLGLTYLEDERPQDALEEFQAVFNADREFTDKLPADAASAARYLFGVAYAKLGRFVDAKQEIQRALAINPRNEDARDLLQQIEQITSSPQAGK